MGGVGSCAGAGRYCSNGTPREWAREALTLHCTLSETPSQSSEALGWGRMVVGLFLVTHSLECMYFTLPDPCKAAL